MAQRARSDDRALNGLNIGHVPLDSSRVPLDRGCSRAAALPTPSPLLAG